MLAAVLLAVLVVSGAPAACRAETMSEALAAAYAQNPDLDQQRAATRASDEAVARARSGYRPKVEGHASGGFTDTEATNARALDQRSGPATPRAADLTVRQMLFDGNKTTSLVGAAESRMYQSRETLRAKEQAILLASATAYMDVLRDTALLDLRGTRILVLRLRLREARARARVGEDTPTDVAQAASYLAVAHAAYAAAQGQLQASLAAYRRYIGHAPRRLEAARPLDALLPGDLATARRLAEQEHPQIQAALHKVDALISDEKAAEAALDPELTLRGKVERSEQDHGNPQRNLFAGTVAAHVDWDIYAGGAADASVREVKERVGEARSSVEIARRAVRASLETQWGLLQSTKELVQSARAAVHAAETAYVEVREEAKIGQRTLLDELKADQQLEDARELLVAAQHDRVLDTYQVLASVGWLSKDRLSLPGARYDPALMSRMVTDKWIGLRTPDGR